MLEPASAKALTEARGSLTRIFFQRIPTAAASAEGGRGGHPQVGLQHLKPQLSSTLPGWTRVRGATTRAPCPTVPAQTASPTPSTSVPAGATASFQFLLPPLSPPPPPLPWSVFRLSLQASYLLSQVISWPPHPDGGAPVSSYTLFYRREFGSWQRREVDT